MMSVIKGDSLILELIIIFPERTLASQERTLEDEKLEKSSSSSSDTDSEASTGVKKVRIM